VAVNFFPLKLTILIVLMFCSCQHVAPGWFIVMHSCSCILVSNHVRSVGVCLVISLLRPHSFPRDQFRSEWINTTRKS
jgi:hypothetical protein